MTELSYKGYDKRHARISLASIPAGSIHRTDVLIMCEELRRLCKSYNLNLGVVWSQIWHETGGFQMADSEWSRRKNPAGIKNESGDAFMRYYNGVDSARAMVNHVLAYVEGMYPFPILDPRCYKVLRIFNDTPIQDRAKVSVVAKSWAEDPNYAVSIQAIYTRTFLLDGILPPVLIVSGHRNLSGGNPAERDKTDDLARAYLKAFQAAGIRAEWWQQIDGDGDPDDSLSYLADVAIGCRDWLHRQNGPAFMLDLHFEGGGQPGIFAIYPDWEGDRNATDSAWAERLSLAISEATGIDLRRSGVISPGVMSEKQTGVGGQGYRLGMFDLTASERGKCYRLVIEHGSLDKQPDAGIIESMGISAYADRCAKAVAAAIREGWG